MTLINYNTIDAYKNAATPTQEETQKADSGFAELLKEETPAEMLEEITKDGIEGVLKWHIKQLEKQYTKSTMSDMQLTPEKIARMPTNMRVAIEKKIMSTVQEQVKLAIQEELRKKNGLAATKMDMGTMQGIYSALQETMA